MLNYFRRLKFTTKVFVSSFILLIFLISLNILFNLFFFLVLRQADLTEAQHQFFSTIDLLSLISLIVFGIFGFHFLLTQMVSFPYNEHKMEVSTTIFLVLFLLMFIPVTLSTSQLQLSFSIKLILDVAFLLIGSIYVVLATGMLYLSTSGVLTRRYARWSLVIFVFFYAYPILSGVKIDSLTLTIFTSAYLIGIIFAVFREFQVLLSKDRKIVEKKEEIVSFIIIIVVLLLLRATVFPLN
jgi:hypothetical protein